MFRHPAGFTLTALALVAGCVFGIVAFALYGAPLGVAACVAGLIVASWLACAGGFFWLARTVRAEMA